MPTSSPGRKFSISFGEWKKKKHRQRNGGDENGGFELSDSTEFLTSASYVSLGDELDGAITVDSFQKEVVKKTQELLIGRQEAETEVFLDLIIKEQGSKDIALLYILSTMKLVESKTVLLVNNLLSRGANISATVSDLKTPLHHAVTRNFKGVAVKLLENDALPHARDKGGLLPLQIAMTNKNDEMCALLLAYMPNRFVRNLFIADGQKDAELSFRDLLTPSFHKTLLSVLDCMIENRGCKDSIRVYYNILDADDKGRPPNDPHFDHTSKSPLQLISYEGQKSIVYHDAVRLLTRRKWKEYASDRFEFNAFLFMLTLFSLTYSAVVAVGTPDPTVYNNALQISRGVFEAFSLIMVLFALITEINQLRRHRLDYFREPFNWLDFSSSVLLLSVPPLRFTYYEAQWHVFAFGYLIWVIRIFKFAAVFRQTGAYAQILYRVIVHDFIQFGMLFLVILLAFSGAFFLSLRGDYNIHTHEETSTFWGILFVGVRTLTEAQPVLEYAGEEGYSTISTIFMVVFIFACCVILLNILIAQLSDTYQKVQQDAQRGLEVNRAWIVARVELNSCFWFRKDFRTANYIEYEDIHDLKQVLTKWESPPLNEMNKYIRDIWDSIDNHKMSLLTVQHRMARQENALREIRDRLTTLTELLTNQNTGSGSSRPVFYGSDIDRQLAPGLKHNKHHTRHAPDVTDGVNTRNAPDVTDGASETTDSVAGSIDDIPDDLEQRVEYYHRESNLNNDDIKHLVDQYNADNKTQLNDAKAPDR